VRRAKQASVGHIQITAAVDAHAPLAAFSEPAREWSATMCAR